MIAGLVHATGSAREFAFRHPLVRRSVYDDAPPAWRPEAHERAAAALERRGAAAEGLSDLDDLVCARDVATAQLLMERYRDAAATSARALALVGRDVRAPLLCRLSVVRAGAFGNLLDLASALDAIDTAEGVARRQGLPQLLLFVLWQRAVINHVRGEEVESETAVAQTRELIARIGPSELTRTATCVMAALSWSDRDPDVA